MEGSDGQKELHLISKAAVMLYQSQSIRTFFVAPSGFLVFFLLIYIYDILTECDYFCSLSKPTEVNI